MISLVLEPADGQPLAAALPGQFVVLRLGAGIRRPALMRSYSLSGEPGAERYRVSVKREAHGAAGAYIDDKLQVGDVVDASARAGQLHAAAGRRARRLPECRHRRDPGARDAPRAGGRSVAEGSLVAPRSPQPPRASVCRGGARAPQQPCPTATATSATARPIPRIGRVWISTLAGAWTCACSRSWACRATPTSMSADRPPS